MREGGAVRGQDAPEVNFARCFKIANSKDRSIRISRPAGRNFTRSVTTRWSPRDRRCQIQWGGVAALMNLFEPRSYCQVW